MRGNSALLLAGSDDPASRHKRVQQAPGYTQQLRVVSAPVTWGRALPQYRGALFGLVGVGLTGTWVALRKGAARVSAVVELQALAWPVLERPRSGWAGSLSRLLCKGGISFALNTSQGWHTWPSLWEQARSSVCLCVLLPCVGVGRGRDQGADLCPPSVVSTQVGERSFALALVWA